MTTLYIVFGLALAVPILDYGSKELAHQVRQYYERTRHVSVKNRIAKKPWWLIPFI
jgi:hypothetical protein